MADIERKGEIKESDVDVIPEEIEVPDNLKKIERKEGLQPTKTQFTAQVTDDMGQTLTSSPASKAVTITLPGTEETLENLSKGSSENAVVWFARYWIRMLAKALHFGWKIILGKQK